MSEKIYDVPSEWSKRAYVDDAKYQEMYSRSIKDPDGFWAEHGAEDTDENDADCADRRNTAERVRDGHGDWRSDRPCQ